MTDFERSQLQFDPAHQHRWQKIPLEQQKCQDCGLQVSIEKPPVHYVQPGAPEAGKE